MQKEFPELRRVRGHYYDGVTRRPHWWLVGPDGDIIDPTAKQFYTNGRGIYEERDEDEPEPTGRCINCGDYVYDGKTCCCEACDREAISFCMNRG